MTKKRGGDEDDELWQAVARTVTPYARRAAAPKNPKKQPAAAPPLSPARPSSAKRPPPSRPAAPPQKGFDAATRRKLERGQLPVEGRLDLHGMTQAEAFAALVRFIDTAARAGRRNLLVITGKGLKAGGGVLRRLLPQWAEEFPLREKILALSPARPRDGGEGAFYVRLRKPEKI
jgi:DNA-nicking Smr family endonuclease